MNQKPRFERPIQPHETTEARDTRVVFGARCTFWGDIYQIGLRPMGSIGMPCCPHCGGPLVEQPNDELVMKATREKAEQDNDPGWVPFVVWLKGKECQPLYMDSVAFQAGFAKLRAEFDALPSETQP